VVLERTAHEFDAPLRLLDRLPEKRDGLKGVSLKVILPGEVYEPSLNALTGFWRTALARYGLEKEQVDRLEFARNQIPSGVLATTQ